MNQLHKLLRWAWSILVVCTLAFAMGGCGGKSHTAQAGQPSQTVVTEDGKQSSPVAKDDKS